MSDPEYQLELLGRKLQKVQEETEELQARMTEVEASGSDEQDLVKVTVNVAGELTDISFRPRALSVGGTLLADAVKDAYRKAKENVGDRVKAESPDLDALKDKLTSIFGTPGDFEGSPLLRDLEKRVDDLGEPK